MEISINILLAILAIFFLCFSSFLGRSKTIFSFISSILLFAIPFILSNFNLNFDKIKITGLTLNAQNSMIYAVSIFSLICIFCEQRLLSKFKYEVFYIASILSISACEIAFFSNDFLKTYILLELISVSTVVLISGGFRDENSGEAGLKYIISSSIGSVIFLLGLVMVYYNFGNFSFTTNKFLLQGSINQIGAIYCVGISLIFLGIFIKIGVFPFQVWIADSYSGSKISIVNYVNAVPKIGIFLFFFNLVNEKRIYLPQNVLNKLLFFLIIGIVFASIRLVSQFCIKRLLAYSGCVTSSIVFAYCLISQNINFSFDLLEKNLFIYILAYSFSCIAISFSCLFLFKPNSQSNNFSSKDFVFSEFFYIIFLIGMFSLASIPPVLGFFGKFYFIKTAIIHGGVLSIFYIFSMIFASILGSFYYFKLPSKLVLIESRKNIVNADIFAKYTSIISCILLGIVLIFGSLLF